MVPAYIFNPERLRANLGAYMRNYTVYYPCKVNSAKEVVAVINACGSSFETDSIEMITHLLGQGICPNKILYNYLVRSSDSIEKAVSFGVDNFAVDCRTQ